jgi:uncharacterized protein YbjQ (UPF0145 family)
MERKPYPSDVRDDTWTLQRAHRPCWVLGSLLLGVITCWLVACASLNTTMTPYAGASHYPPGDPASVQILRTEPTKSHDRLGEIVVDAATHSATPGNKVEQKLRQEAAKLGADAVVVVYDRLQPMGASVMSGYWDRSIETVTGHTIVGVAIKYRP